MPVELSAKTYIFLYGQIKRKSVSRNSRDGLRPDYPRPHPPIATGLCQS